MESINATTTYFSSSQQQPNDTRLDAQNPLFFIGYIFNLSVYYKKHAQANNRFDESRIKREREDEIDKRGGNYS